MGARWKRKKEEELDDLDDLLARLVPEGEGERETGTVVGRGSSEGMQTSGEM
jgi:hypothetical protein